MEMVKGIFRVRNASEGKKKKKKEKWIYERQLTKCQKVWIGFRNSWIQLRLFNLHLVWKKVAATWIILTTSLTTVNRGFLGFWRTVSLLVSNFLRFARVKRLYFSVFKHQISLKYAPSISFRCYNTRGGKGQENDGKNISTGITSWEAG